MSDSDPRFICIHGHFYQPPRENPWTGLIERQESARPFHDWNERITAECYAPNAASPILDEEGRIDGTVDNYGHISFDFGPTLLSWLETHAPGVYESILRADETSAARFGGHGSAMAQAFHHVIMPLASPRDRRTQARWGVEDFRWRFGRKPEGMWLPETAVDLDTLEALAEEDVRFTVLAPHQARRVRPLGADGRAAGKWSEVRDASIDTARPYLQRLPSGRSIALFFYDGPASRAVAFENLLSDGARFAHRLAAGFRERPGPQLSHIATDGESYGHHHAHGNMALAYAIRHIEREGLARLTNYGEFLALRAPDQEVEIREDTSWSCVHGVERWRADCGCRTGGEPEWHQAWRAPLRGALDWLREELDPRFETAATGTLRDPWHARDDYIRVLLERSVDVRAAFLARHEARSLDDEAARRTWRLLELQRQAMRMYTSCGWFFNEISGIETVQVLQYAARAIELAAELFDVELEEPFLERLERAHSNHPDFRHGRDVYEARVRPVRAAAREGAGPA